MSLGFISACFLHDNRAVAHIQLSRVLLIGVPFMGLWALHTDAQVGLMDYGWGLPALGIRVSESALGDRCLTIRGFFCGCFGNYLPCCCLECLDG